MMSEEQKTCPDCGSTLDYLPQSMRGGRFKEIYGKCWCWKCFKKLRGKDSNVPAKESEVQG